MIIVGNPPCPKCGTILRTDGHCPNCCDPPVRRISHDDGLKIEVSDNPKLGAWMCVLKNVTVIPGTSDYTQQFTMKFYGESYYLAWRAAQYRNNSMGTVESMKRTKP